MDTIHERRPDHEMQLFWMEQAGVLAEIQGEYKGRRSYWDDGKAQDSADNTEGATPEGEKTQGRAKGTEECGVAARDTKKRTPRNRRE